MAGHLLHQVASQSNIFINFFNETLNLWLSVSPYLLLGMFIAGLLHVFLGQAFISRQLGRPGFWSIIKATLLGIPLPVCSCGVIPLANSLEKDGAHKSSILAFMVSTPTTGVDSILATYSLMGPLFAIFRPLAALVEGLSLGLIHYFTGGGKETPKISAAHSHKPETIHFKISEVFRYAFFEMPQDLGRWLILGTILGGAISAAIPQDLLSKYFFFPLDFIAALAVGIPLYVCATGSIPIAVSLMAKGFSPGAALVFLIAGPATNAITLSFVRVKMGRRAFWVYLSGIVIVAVLMGLIFNFLWLVLGQKPELISGAGAMLSYEIKLISAIILFTLIAIAFLKQKPVGQFIAEVDIAVPDIHCPHCRETLEKKLRPLEGVEEIFVDLGNKTVKIRGGASKELIISKIKEAGYHPVE